MNTLISLDSAWIWTIQNNETDFIRFKNIKRILSLFFHTVLNPIEKKKMWTNWSMGIFYSNDKKFSKLLHQDYALWG
jgi:hypothetical protein